MAEHGRPNERSESTSPGAPRQPPSCTERMRSLASPAIILRSSALLATLRSSREGAQDFDTHLCQRASTSPGGFASPSPISPVPQLAAHAQTSQNTSASTVTTSPSMRGSLVPSPKDELRRLGSGEEPKRDEGRSRARRNVHVSGSRAVEPRHELGSRVRERDATTREGQTDLARMQVTCEDQIEGRAWNPFDDPREVAEQQTKRRPLIDQFVGPSLLRPVVAGSTPTTAMRSPRRTRISASSSRSLARSRSRTSAARENGSRVSATS